MADLEFTVGPVVDQGATATAARQLGSGLSGATAEATRRMVKDLGIVGKEVAKIGEQAKKNFNFGDDIGAAFRRAGKDSEAFRKDVKAISDQLEGVSKLQGKGLLDPQSFTNITRASERAYEIMRKIGTINFSDGGAVRELAKDLEGLRRSSNSAVVALQGQIKQTAEVERSSRQAAAATANLATAAAREKLSAQNQAQRLQLLSAREASTQRLAAEAAGLNATRTAARLQVVEARSAGQQRVAITRATLDTIGRLERAFGATVSGIARTTTGAVEKVWASSFGRLTRHHSTSSRTIENIQRNYQSSSLSSSRSFFSRQERQLTESTSRQTRIIANAQAKSQAGVIGVANRRNLLGGLAVGGGIAGLLTSGFERASTLESLNKQFVALTQNAESAGLLMKQVTEFARITPFDLTGVASLAKGFLTMGTAASDVLPKISAVTDAVALTGGGTEQLERIQRALGQVISSGKLQGDEFNQLAESLPGLNINKLLADQLTGGDIPKLMADRGKITGTQFLEAFITGLQNDPRLAFATLQAADTLKGRLDNLKEGFADFGASIIEAVSTPMKQAFTVATQTLQTFANVIRGKDGAGVPVSEGLLQIRTAIIGVTTALGGLLALKVAVESFGLLGKAVALALTPMGLLVVAVGAIGGAFALLQRNSESFRDAFSSVTNALGGAKTAVFDAIGDAIGRVRDAIFGGKEVIAQSADAIERSLSAIGGVAKTGIDPLVRRAVPAFNIFTKAAGFLVTGIKAATDFLVTSAIPAIAKFAEFLIANVGPALSKVADIARNAYAKGLEIGGKAVDSFRERWQKAQPTIVAITDKIKAGIDAVQETLSKVGSLSGKAIAGIGGAALAGVAILGPVGAVLAGSAALLGVTFRKQIGSALTGVKDIIVGFFEGIDWAGLAAGAIGFAERVGFVIGNIATDPRFVAGLLAIAAAGVAVGAKFLIGFTKGVIDNLPGLASLGVQIVGIILDGITSNPELFVGAIAAFFLVPKLFSTLKTAGSAAAKSYAAGLQTSLKAVGTQVTSTLGAPLAQAGTGFISKFKLALGAGATGASTGFVGKFVSGFKTDFAAAGQNLGLTTGQQIGTALTAGFASVVSGQALGKGNKLAGIGGIIASSLTAAAVTGNAGVGVAVGALGLITAAFTASGEKAKETAARIKTFADAIRGATDEVSAFKAVTDTFTTNFNNQSVSTQQAFADFGPSFAEIGRIAEGSAAQLAAFNDAAKRIDRVGDNFTVGVTSAADFKNIALAANTGIAEADAAFKNLTLAFIDGDITSKQFTDSLKFLQDQVNAASQGALSASYSQVQLSKDVRDAADTAGDGSVQFGRSSAALLEMRNQLGANQKALAIDNAKKAADDAATAFDLAKSALYSFLNPQAGTITEDINGILTGLTGLGSSVQGGIDLGGAIGGAGVDTAVANLKDQIFTAISTGAEDGLTTEAIQTALANLVPAIDELEITDEAKQKLKDAVIGIVLDPVPIQSVVDTASAAQTAADIAAAVTDGIPTSGLEDTGKKVIEGFSLGMGEAQAGAVARAKAVAEAVTLQLEQSFDVHSPSRVAATIGGYVGEGLAEGIAGSAGIVGAASVDAAAAAIRGVASAVNQAAAVGTTLGSTIGTSISEGIIDATSEITSVIDQVLVDAAERADFADQIKGLIGGAFSNVFGGAGGTFDAGLGLDTALQDLVKRAIDAGPFKGLDSGQFGIENLQAVQNAVGAIQTLAEDRLANGSSPGEVANLLQGERTKLIDFGTFLGFSTDELIKLVDALGLSTTNIEAFAHSAADAALLARQRATDEAAQKQLDAKKKELQEQEDAAAEAKRLAEESQSKLAEKIEVNLNIPFGDPAAIGLSVVNALASRLR